MFDASHQIIKKERDIDIILITLLRCKISVIIFTWLTLYTCTQWTRIFWQDSHHRTRKKYNVVKKGNLPGRLEEEENALK